MYISLFNKISFIVIDKPTKSTKIGTNPAFGRSKLSTTYLNFRIRILYSDENQSRSNTTVHNSSINLTTNEIGMYNIRRLFFLL